MNKPIINGTEIEIQQVLNSLTNQERKYVLGDITIPKPTLYLYVYKINNIPVGYIKLNTKKFFDGNGYVELAINPNYRNKGIAKILMNKMIKDITTNYPDVTIYYNTDYSNIASQKFAEKYGFKLCDQDSKFKRYTYSENTFYLEDKRMNELEKVFKFNQELKNFKYGLKYPQKSEVDTKNLENELFHKYYKFAGPKQFVKQNGGICWDFTTYEADWFTKNLSNIKYDCYFIILVNKYILTNHTFLVFNYNNKYYWIENAAGKYNGIYEADNIQTIFNFVIDLLHKACPNKELLPKATYEIYKYNALDSNMYDLSYYDTAMYMLKHSKRISHTYSSNIKINSSSINEACKDIATARQFVADVDKLAKKYDANYFIVTDGASGIHNNGNPAVRNAKLAQIKWEKENNGEPNEDWSNNIKNGKYTESYINENNTSLYNEQNTENNDIEKYDPNFKSNKKLNLSSFKMINIKDDKSINDIINNFKSNDSKKYIKELKMYYKWYNSENNKFDRSMEFIIWLNNTELVAYAIIQKFNDRVNYLTPMVISPSFRGYGLSNQIMDLLIKNYNVNELTVERSNTVAINLYKKYGFTFTNKYKGKKNQLFMVRNHNNTNEGFVMENLLANKNNYNTPPTNESAINENYLFSKSDIWYNIEDFLNGNTNLIMIVGYSGSGKSTARRMLIENKPKDIWINVEMDLTLLQFKFKDEKLKKINPLGYKFLTSSIGKKYRIPWIDYMSTIRTNKKAYFDEFTRDFLNFIVKEASENKNNKYIVDGIWPILHGIGPEFFQDWCVLLKGTSYVTSVWRATGRSLSDKYDAVFLDRIFSFIYNLSPLQYKNLGDTIEHSRKLYEKYFVFMHRTQGKSLDIGSTDRVNSLFESSIIQEGWRANLPTKSFGIPDQRKYPLHDKKHVQSAIKLFSHASEDRKKLLAKRINSAAKKYNIEIPKTTQCYKYLHSEQDIFDINNNNLLIFREDDNQPILIDISDINHWQIGQRPQIHSSISLSNYWDTLASATISEVDKAKANGEFNNESSITRYVFISPEELSESFIGIMEPICVGQIILYEDYRYLWDIQYPLLLNEADIIISNKESMSISSFNPIVGRPNYMLINTGYPDLVLTTDPESDIGMTINESGLLDIVYLSKDMPIYEAYSYIGPKDNLDFINELYKNNTITEFSMYELLSNRRCLTEDQINYDPYFKRINFNEIAENLETNMATFREQVISCMLNTSVPIVENVKIDTIPSYDEISILEDFDGYYYYSNITNKRSRSVNEKSLLTEDMLHSVL